MRHSHEPSSPCRYIGGDNSQLECITIMFVKRVCVCVSVCVSVNEYGTESVYL